MLVVEVELLTGTVRASTGDLALAGNFEHGEWPLSPARLFEALVAADGTGTRQHVTDGSELRVLEKALPPVIMASRRGEDPDEVLESPLQERYVVKNERSEGSVQDYPARQNELLRHGTRLSPRTPTLWYRWPELEPDAHTLAALRRRAARVSYLGCADSPVRLRVLTEDVNYPAEVAAWRPVEGEGEGEVALPVPFPGFLEVLDAAYERFLRGAPQRGSWLQRAERWYATGTPATAPRPRPKIVWLRFERAFPGRLARTVAETLRRAMLERYDQIVAGSSGALPPVLTGHGYSGRGYHHVQWLVLPDVGRRYATGRIHGAAIWLPSDTSPEVIRGVRRACASLRELVLIGGRSSPVRVHDGTPMPSAANPRRWFGPARRWATALPVVHERFGAVSLEDVQRWCRHADLPEPVAFRRHRLPFVEGGLVLRTDEVHRRDGPRLPYSHFELEFADEVLGPVVIGQARQFGMGLALPIATRRTEERVDG